MFWVKTPALLEQVFKDAWWTMENSENAIYLTFDDGPHPDTTPFILNLFRKYNYKATFFCTGKAVEAYPELYEQILEEGHAVGNHSYSHFHSWKTGSSEYLEDIGRAGKIIDSKLFRPPYGKLKRAEWLQLKHLYQVVMWSIMPHDYKTNLPSDTILQRLKKNSGPGDIVVLHENNNSKEHIRTILPAYLEFLKAKNLKPKRLPDVD